MSENINELIHKRTFNKNQKLHNIYPVIYNLNDEESRKAFNDLLNKNTSLVLYDEIYEQLIEFIQIRNVSKKLSKIEIDSLISEHINNIPFERYGLWIYFPWLNKAVHSLYEEEFIEVRTNRNQHKITKNEIDVLRKKKIGIIGLSVGQSIAFTLVSERCCGEIRLADFDDIQLSNLNRIKTGLYNLGLLKCVQVAREIAELDPFIKVICYNEGVNEHNIEDFLCNDGPIDLLIEECDSLDVKILSRIKAKEFGIPVIMETNDRGMVDVERYDLSNGYPLLHGLLGSITVDDVKDLTQEKSLPVFMKFFNFNTVSDRAKVTLLELGQTVSTWPQIASAVILGAGVVTDTARRVLLNQLTVSGRFNVDLETIICNTEPATPSYIPPYIKEISKKEMVDIVDTINLQSSEFAISEFILEKIISDAAKAPSSGNDQPWKFLFHDNILYLFNDIARSYSFGNYKNMTSFISLGTAIENTVLSSHHYDQEISVQLFPKKNNDACVAAMKFMFQQNELTENHEFDALYNYVSLRSTNRKIAENEIAPEPVLQELKKVTESIPGAEVLFVTDREKLTELGLIISACDRIRIMNPQAHYEFFNREIHWSKAAAENKKTGMEVSALELTQPALLALKTISNPQVINILSDINGLKAYKNIAVPGTVNSGAMGLITMPDYNPYNFVNGGRAVQRQWLKSTELDYAYHPMLIPLYLFSRLIFGNGQGLSSTTADELKELRKRFMRIFPGNETRGEIFLFRIFKAKKNENVSLRLPLSEILYK